MTKKKENVLLNQMKNSLKDLKSKSIKEHIKKEDNLSKHRQFHHSTTENDIVVSKYGYPEDKVKEFIKKITNKILTMKKKVLTRVEAVKMIEKEAGEVLL